MPTTEIQRGINVEAGETRLAGELHVPPQASGFVLFASDQPSMRLNRRQIDLSEALNESGLGTLLFDLVDPGDGLDGKLEVLAERLLGASEWVSERWGVAGLPLGYVSSGLGSAAALVAAAELGPELRAVAIRGGRPDLAGPRLGKVEAATFFAFAGDNPVEAEAAISAASRVRGPQRLRNYPSQEGPNGSWGATPAICSWLQWHLSL